ncbi:MAG: LysE family translocator [Leptothrix sp. (in: b-proteobacteria)]
MTGIHNLALFSLTVLVLNATPGVDLVYTVTRTLQHGVRDGLAAALGVSAGCIVHALGAAFGLAALMATSAAAFNAIKWAGAAYLLWLALGLMRQALWPAASVAPAAGSSPEPAKPPAAHPRLRHGATFRQGLFSNVLNPKVAIFFLALLPQFIAADAPHKTVTFLALGGWFVLQTALFLAVVVALVAPLRRWQPGAAVRRALAGLSGLLFLGLAARLALTEHP